MRILRADRIHTKHQTVFPVLVQPLPYFGYRLHRRIDVSLFNIQVISIAFILCASSSTNAGYCSFLHCLLAHNTNRCYSRPRTDCGSRLCSLDAVYTDAALVHIIITYDVFLALKIILCWTVWPAIFCNFNLKQNWVLLMYVDVIDTKNLNRVEVIYSWGEMSASFARITESN